MKRTLYPFWLKLVCIPPPLRPASRLVCWWPPCISWPRNHTLLFLGLCRSFPRFQSLTRIHLRPYEWLSISKFKYDEVDGHPLKNSSHPHPGFPSNTPFYTHVQLSTSFMPASAALLDLPRELLHRILYWAVIARARSHITGPLARRPAKRPLRLRLVCSTWLQSTREPINKISDKRGPRNI